MKNTIKQPFIGKKAFKRRAGKCQICGENKYKLLDVHRIIWGGDYINTNCANLCVACHRKVHTYIIKIIGWKHSTCGPLLHIIDENGEEQFV